MTRAADWLHAQLGYRFSDAGLLEQALTHRSARRRDHNERLEFLGDALLSFIIADMIYHARSDHSEGDLSRLRSNLVRGATLADIAVDIGLGDHLILGGGELKSGGHQRRSILADGFEALLGAIYLDGGTAAARDVVERLFGPRLAALPAGRELKDPKTRLQELLQGRGLALPGYQVVDVRGEEHAQEFTVHCELTELELSFAGEGSSRRVAEQAAAERALAHLEVAAK